MKQQSDKKAMHPIAKKYLKKHTLTAKEIQKLYQFTFTEPKRDFTKLRKRATYILSVIISALIIIFPDKVEEFALTAPDFLFLSERLALALDYVWSIIGKPTGEQFIVYHLPNIILYSFGIIGIKNIIQAIAKNDWRAQIREAQQLLKKEVEQGTLTMKPERGFSILFLGDGDTVGEALAKDKDVEGILLSRKKPYQYPLWHTYDMDSGYESLEKTLIDITAQNAGEYIFFPAKDEELFLPGPEDFDVAPHRLDIIIRDIRAIEKEKQWDPKRIIIVGDTHHASFFQTSNKRGILPESHTAVSFESVVQRYNNISIIDPTDLVLQEIISRADGATINLRASDQGVATYAKRFYERLDKMVYTPKNKSAVITIGYDIFGHQTQQQSLEMKDQNYLPVVFAHDIYQALLRNGFEKENIIFIPTLLHQKLEQEVLKQ